MKGGQLWAFGEGKWSLRLFYRDQGGRQQPPAHVGSARAEFS